MFHFRNSINIIFIIHKDLYIKRENCAKKKKKKKKQKKKNILL